jgi:pimeloyl-ACP methyl ester carboxylesterase
MGCGQSKFQGNHHLGGKKQAAADNITQQQQATTTYLERAVQDLSCLIRHVLMPDSEEDASGANNNSFHLLGHSLGGIIAFEYLKTVAPRNDHAPSCLSVILASTPISIAASQASKKALLQSLAKEASLRYSQLLPKRKVGDVDDDDDDDLGPMSQAVHVEFSKRHECRIYPMPALLQHTLCNLQTHQVISESEFAVLQRYHATLTDLDEIPPFPPALITRGEHDFVTPENSRGWTELLVPKGNDEVDKNDDDDENNYNDDDDDDQKQKRRHARFVTITKSGHYSMIDNEEMFGTVVTAFLRKHDPKDG